MTRCALSFDNFLELTSVEQHRWHAWFTEHPDAWRLPFATGRTATIGGLVLHIFGVELRYAQRLLEHFQCLGAFQRCLVGLCQKAAQAHGTTRDGVCQ